MPRFLHTADWQIGRQFDTFDPEDGPLLAQARIDTVERIARLATERSVDAVLVAGDVFDAQGVSDRTVRRLFEALSGYTGPWVMLPGNHDAALAEGVWRRALRLSVVPANVTVLLEPRPLLLASQGFAILPAPLTQRHTYSDLTAWFNSSETPPDLLRIGLAHGAVQGVLPDTIDSANPIAADRVSQARLDYLALGDWHGCKSLSSRCWYSGTPEPDRFRNNEAGLVLEVEIAAPGAEPQVQRHRVGRHAWVSIEKVLQVPSDLDGLETELLQTLEPNAVVEIKLTGQVSLTEHRRVIHVVAAAEGRHRAVRASLEGLRLIPTDEDLAALHADGYLGEVLNGLRQELRHAPSGEADPVLQQALLILADAMVQTRSGGVA